MDLKGNAIDVILQKINREVKPTKQDKKKRDVKNSFQYGKLSTKDWSLILNGLGAFRRYMNSSFDNISTQILAGSEDIGRVKRELVQFRGVINAAYDRLSRYAKDTAGIQRGIEDIKPTAEIVQAARDGILIKKESREEIINGEKKVVEYDTSFSPQEVAQLFRDYSRNNEMEYDKKIAIALHFGLGAIGMMGTLTPKMKDKNFVKDYSLAGISTIVISAMKIVQSKRYNINRKNDVSFMRKRHELTREVIENEQISDKAINDTIFQIIEIAKKEQKAANKTANEDNLYDIAISVINLLVSGKFVSSRLTFDEQGKVDPKSLSKALIALQANKAVFAQFSKVLEDYKQVVDNKSEQKELKEKIDDIMGQMEEKVYPLKSPTTKFNSFSISNFNGKFYPKKNYETDEIEYETKIQIPEFTVKKGEVVLLTGESGSGKSTFLRLLKRGDINNRKAITLSSGEKVDNLGGEYISFKPDINLGNEENVLFQITGKKNVSDLASNEKSKLEKIMKELNLDFEDLTEKLASKKFMEFSTGQQRRLALSKLFYSMDDDVDVVIVDEPVGNVEDSLIEQQLEMIKKYAQNRNLMLILTTHRVNIAEKLATKRYHLENGVLTQLPVNSQIKENELDEK